MYSLPLWSWLAIMVTMPLVPGAVEVQTLSSALKYTASSVGEKTVFNQGLITGEKVTLEKQQSPYLVRKDIIIGEDGELRIEPGVTVFFAPTVGITVYGVLTAKVCEV
ncbi:hypothetical protein V9T40_002826 [Parthenolecanium corni]|uniref:Uncharacterized protein n=1 Tax=Parthenolecanium corni TaxID=536013 RepID=A0AAN9Y5Z5_9HEMI